MQNDLINELGTNFIEYAVAVNTDRSIPDAKSGLKPVAKRILWSAFEEGRVFSKPHVKAARIVGDVMGKYHPHGDSSIYGAMVRLSQDWIMRYPLIDWHGNNGNIAGDGPAAARYTEARLSKIAEEGMLAGIKKKNVDFILNYSEDAEEPVTLPTIFPNLLCNPNSGIGVAMACNWLPHNLNEVAQAIYDYMDDKEPMIPGPDFPTGGIIINKNDIPAIMRTGHGSVKVRGRYKVEKNNIVFYEIPYGTTIEGIMTEIGQICDEKGIEGISDIRDESNKKGLRIVIECQKGSNPDGIAQKLYAKTSLQTSISYNQVALVSKTPTELNLKQCLEIYLKHNHECLIKEAEFDLIKAKARLEIVRGLLIALEDIDNVIALIKKSESAAAAKVSLIEKYNLSENQAKAILDMKLSRLAKLEKIELQKEEEELLSQIDYCNRIIEAKLVRDSIIRDRLEAIVRKFGDARKTELTHIEIKPEEKEIIEVIPEDVVVILSQTGDIKRIPAKSFKVQKRNGKGVKNEGDAILDVISTNTIDNLMLFTSKGKMYRLLVDNVPAGTNASKGVNISSLLNIEPDEKVIAMTSLNRKTDAEYVVFVTKQGLIKKTALEEYKSVKRNTGIAAIKLKEGDSIANVTFLKDEEIIVITKEGMSIHFTTADINPIGRATSGVKSIKLDDEDEVLIGLPIHKKTDNVAIITTKGLGKKVALEEFPLQGRGGKGVYAHKPSEMTGKIAGAAMVDNEDNILVVGKPNSICISAEDMPTTGRAAAGNIIIKNEVKHIVKI
jgi:DNA gyrase subunit A